MVVEANVCFVEKFCAHLIFLIGVAISAMLNGVVATVGGVVGPGGMAALITGAVVVVGGLLLARIVCTPAYCRCSASPTG